jgi:uncharacterized protein DUF4412
MKRILSSTRTTAAGRAIQGTIVATFASLAACSHSSDGATADVVVAASASASASPAPSATSPSVVDKALSFLSGGPFEGEITMSITPEVRPAFSTVFDVKGEKMRFSAPSSALGQERRYSLVDFGNKKMVDISDTNKTAMILNWDEVMGAAAARKKPSVTPVATGRKDVVAGYVCDIYQNNDPSSGGGEACVAKGIHFPHGLVQGSWIESLGDDWFPMRVDTKSPVDEQKLHMEVTKVDKKPLDDSLFAIPPGYETESLGDIMKRSFGKGQGKGQGCPCGCDRSEAMVADLSQEAPTSALDTIDETLAIIAEREDAGYITEAMIQHRLRLLALRASVGQTGATGRQAPSGGRGVPLPKNGRGRRLSPVVDNAELRVQGEMTAHGEATEVVRGREKLLRPSFRIGLEIENVSGAAVTLETPVVEGGVGFPVSRWYVLGGDGRPWDGTLAAGQQRSVNVIGYLGEPVKPGTELDATVHLGSLALRTTARARRRWNQED